MSPLLKWSLAIIAGGGAAGAIQGATVAARAASTAVTGGLGNPVVATVELGAAAVTSVVAVVAPLLAVTILALALLFFGRTVVRGLRKPTTTPVRSSPT
jgi:hypothetical protein